ncbi:MAG: DUF3108 domain-containing protein [Pseudomonadota bacterium]
MIENLLKTLLTILLSSPFFVISVSADVLQKDSFAYDARMAFLKAGELSLDLSRTGDQYEVAGEFKTSRAMSAYYTWNGIFAAVGTWQRGGPVTKAYMARTTGKDDDLKIVLTYEDGARVLDDSTGGFESVNKPGGIDLISALFFSPECYQGGQVHDGEDTYRLTLRSEKVHRFNGGRGYYKGEVTSCDYHVLDHKDRKRRVIVSLAQVGDTKVAVQVRAKIPILPDAVFRLRYPGKSTDVGQIAGLD